MNRLVILCCVLLAGCATQESVKFVGPSGQYGSGQIAMNGAMGEGRFSVKDEQRSCAGHFSSWSNLTITFPVQCSDLIAGTVTLTRPQDGPLTATGTMVLSNGQTKQIVYGQATHQ
ncbi:MAG: hypothetical protein BGN87_18505 [Rhizobiales bacterium 65-79]|mgnify:CR=1 FL=1|jgi:hypothetical protein|nr:hypothetical protein [Hyphomicrobiales bacterium]OJU03596.1 MAG: hypothetical protein BGN87_18505 [Rhizobiales bacterium 65-79]